VRGCGGHGAAPQATKDPVASEIVMILQTIVSRKTDPLEHVVVTVGSFHSGTRYNIIRTIPDDAHLQLTVRTMTPQMRAKVLAAITRITNGVAQAAGVPDERKPIIEISKDNVPATVNDAALTKRVATANGEIPWQGKCRRRKTHHGQRRFQPLRAYNAESADDDVLVGSQRSHEV